MIPERAREDGRAAVRAALFVLGLLVAETAARLALEPRSLPDAAAGGLDALARAGRIGVLGILFLLGNLAWLRLRRTRARPGLELAERLVATLCEPARAARLVAVLAAATVALGLTVGRRYDLRWHAGAAFGSLVAAGAAALELAVAAARRRLGSATAGAVGRSLWIGALVALGLLVLPRVPYGDSLVLVTAAGIFVLVPAPARPTRALGALAAGTMAVVAAGILLDGARPALRRFASVHCPYSAGGLAALQYLTDLDRDRSSGLFGLDCDDLDADRHPMADDLPDDGVDQNCTGGDASRARAAARLAPGGPLAPWPPAELATGAPPPVVLVTVDALRADALARMPRVSAWADRCVRFAHARAQANFTHLSLIALHTGLEARHARKGYELLIGRSEGTTRPPLLAVALARAGYHGAAVVALDHPPPFLLPGFAWVRGGEEAPAGKILAVAREGIAAAPAGKPLHLWVHLTDTHAPYGGAGTGRADYDRAVAALDEPLAAFLGELPADAVVVLTSDHGEAFGEHGAYTHQSTLFDEELRVPLVLCAPPDRPLGPPRVVDTPVGAIDVLPTILDLAGIAAPYPRHGESLVAHLRNGAPLRSPWVTFETWLPGHHLQGILDGCWKWIRDLDREWEALYDVCRDPGERDDRAAADPATAARLRGMYFEILDDDLDAYRSWR